MAGKGGYQRPRNPAQVSGPGAMSQRTDGKPSVDNPRQAARYISGQEYGEGQVINEIAQAAPLAAAPDQGTTTPMGGGGGMEMRPRPTSMYAPTERPDEPLTAGVPVGAGPNELAPDMMSKVGEDQDAERMAVLIGILQQAEMRGELSQGGTNALRKLRGYL
jgi:hypothetical protein